MPNKTENFDKKESKRERRRNNYYKQVFQPTIFGKKNRNYRRLPGYQREKWSNLVKTKSEGVVLNWCFAFGDGFGIIFYADND